MSPRGGTRRPKAPSGRPHVKGTRRGATDAKKKTATGNATGRTVLRVIPGGKPPTPGDKPTAKQDEPSFEPTDTGNAEALAHLFPHHLRYVPYWKKFIVYTGTHWKRDLGNVELMKRTKQVIDKIEDAKWQKQSQHRARRAAMVALAESEVISVEPAELDPDPLLLAVGNGVVDLRTGKLRGHRPEDLITKVAPVTFDARAKAPRWNKFLCQVLPDPGVRDFLQRFFGYATSGDVSERVVVVLLGMGRNGKSLLLRTIQTILGPYATTTAPELLMLKEQSAHLTEIASLLGARLAISSEVKKGRTFDEEAIKRLSGDDRLAARRMREDLWEFEPTHKLVVASNHKPKVRDTTDSFWDRFRLVPFNVRIGDKRVNPRLRVELLEERAGILNWVRLFSSATIHSEFDHLTLCSRGLGGGRGSGTRAFS